MRYIEESSNSAAGPFCGLCISVSTIVFLIELIAPYVKVMRCSQSKTFSEGHQRILEGESEAKIC